MWPLTLPLQLQLCERAAVRWKEDEQSSPITISQGPGLDPGPCPDPQDPLLCPRLRPPRAGLAPPPPPQAQTRPPTLFFPQALVSAPSCPNHSNSKDPNVFLCSWSRRTKSEHPLVVRRSDGTSDVSQGQSFRGSALRSEAEQERETHEPDLSPGPACDADGSSPPAIEEQSVQHGGAGTPLGLGIEKLRQNRGQFEDALCQAWEQGCADDCALF
ncbi:hypothetical protein MG293_017322 [Ovis ammon polii]|uniref:Uncharacterized protein n=1 Tax=Ovis ammon polii TaxID=230172 RepID=A0AAD4Y2R8_OVIAM|nr:hypothetical protein MG293_017322 [Ovis ammon polii]